MPAVRGRLYIDVIPGSEVVQDRATGRLVPCTSVLCPNADITPSGLLVNRVHWGGIAASGIAFNLKASAAYKVGGR